MAAKYQYIPRSKKYDFIWSKTKNLEKKEKLCKQRKTK
jgi:hypothetical protein